jgi:hypothetical protein
MTDTITSPAEAEQIELNLRGRRLVLRMRGDVLELSADCDIAIKSDSTLHLSGADGVRIACGESVVDLTPGALSIASEKMTAKARMAECEGREIRLSADLLRISCAKLERIASRVLEYARESYQRVDNLLHIRAGRIRSESQSNHSLHGATVRVDAKEDVRIMGEKIHLR